MITLAPGMAAPEGSVICPRRTPEAVCASDTFSDIKNKNTTAKTRMHFSAFTFFPFLNKLAKLRFRIATPEGAINESGTCGMPEGVPGYKSTGARLRSTNPQLRTLQLRILRYSFFSRQALRLTRISAGSARQTPGSQHHGLTAVGSLENRFNPAVQLNDSASARGRALGRENGDGVSLVQISQ